jgi:hypothetical protein
MTDQVVIDAAERFAKKPLPSEATVDRLWMRGKPEEFRAFFAPSVKALPFVSAEWHNDGLTRRPMTITPTASAASTSPN